MTDKELFEDKLNKIVEQINSNSYIFSKNYTGKYEELIELCNFIESRTHEIRTKIKNG